VLLGIFVRALRMCATGRVEWRGTAYSRSAAGAGDSAGGVPPARDAVARS
jgi:hypothetical protein